MYHKINNYKYKVKTGSLFFGFILALLTSGCAEWSECERPYLVLYAFDEEGMLLAEKMEEVQKDTLLGREVLDGELSGKDIILAESGIGMTNAAMTVQKMIDTYNPKAVIFSGIAGGIDSSVHIGDIVIPEKWATHDKGYYGADSFSVSTIQIYDAANDSLARLLYFEVDKNLLSFAQKLAAEKFIFDSIGTRVPSIKIGRVGVSGNSFIDQVGKRLWLSKRFNALTTDMETAAVAQVCLVNNIPFIGFRSASDLAGGSGSESAAEEIQLFFNVAANNSAKVVMKFLEIL